MTIQRLYYWVSLITCITSLGCLQITESKIAYYWVVISFIHLCFTVLWAALNGLITLQKKIEYYKKTDAI